MSAITDFARGQACTVRLPDGCLAPNTDTSVAAHYRLAGTCGTGIKPPDTNAAIACLHCHDVCDGRKKSRLSKDFIRHAHAEGVMRTLELLARAGYRLRKAA
jgi:hypothetical protein